jgi:hypothetical protein
VAIAVMVLVHQMMTPVRGGALYDLKQRLAPRRAAPPDATP